MATSGGVKLQFFNWQDAVAAIVDNSLQTEVSLSGTDVGDDGARGLAQALKRNRSLVCLFLNGSGVGPRGAVTLYEALHFHPALQTLQMDGCRLDATGAQAVGCLLKKNQKLKELVLTGSDAGESGVQQFAQGLRSNQTLLLLNLSECSLGDKGGEILARVLERNRGLTDLDLSGNSIGCAGGSAVISSLKTNCTLARMGLSRNKLSDSCASSFVEGLGNNATLTCLEIDQNELSDEGARGLAKGLNTNNCLSYLQLDGNQIGLLGAEAILEGIRVRMQQKLPAAIKCYMALTTVSLKNNLLPPDFLTRIQDALIAPGLKPFLSNLLDGRGSARRLGIKDTAERGISLDRLLQLAEFAQDYLTRQNLADESSTTEGKHITWQSATMYHICDALVKPLTAIPCCSYAELVSNDRQPPKWMVSHWWGTRFELTIEMLKFHAEARYGRKRASNTIYWCCTFANNQHNLEELDCNVVASPFARVLCSSDCLGTVLLCDPGVTPMQRIWCVFETHLTEQLRRQKLGSKHWHFLDVAAPVDETIESGKDTLSEDAEITFPVALLQDALVGNWHESSNASNGRFPLEVARIGTQVKIENAQASLDRDRLRILNYVAELPCSVDDAPTTHANYDQLDGFIHSVFASAELYRLAVYRPEGFLTEMKHLLDLHANPNGFVRDGNNALFAAVGCDASGSDPSSDPELSAAAVDLLLCARADTNQTNSSMQTVLDCCSNVPTRTIEKLLAQGAKNSSQVREDVESSANALIETLVSRAFNRTENPFGCRTVGDTEAKLLGPGERCLQAVAAILKRYPGLPCSILVGVGLHSEQAAQRVAERQAIARTLAVRDYLQSIGCSQQFKKKTVEGGRLLQIVISCEESSKFSSARQSDASITLSTIYDDIVATFHKYDLNGDGLLHEAELVTLMETLLPAHSNSDIASLMNAMDLNQDGVIQIEEFVEWALSDESVERVVARARSGD